MAQVLVVGLNPAWQKIMEFGRLHPGEVNRAESLVQLASGKGMNAAKVLRRLGHTVSLLQVLGGSNGQRCLVACQALDIKSLHAWAEEETRQCQTLVDLERGEATEIIEPFAVETEGLDAALLKALPADASAFDAVLISGTVPDGLPNGIYGRILERFHPKVSLLDAYRGVDRALLEQAAVVKVNKREYAVLEPLCGETGPLFLVTDGAGEASVIRDREVLGRIPVTRLERVRNPIGAGDTVSAGTLHFLLEGLEPAEAFRRGLAMGSASCLNLEPAQFAWEEFESLLPKVGPVRKAG
jgi:fructose-1-phosphate kinase PfkB-like protein